MANTANRLTNRSTDRSTDPCVFQHTGKRAETLPQPGVEKTVHSSAGQGVCQCAELFTDWSKKTGSQNSAVQCSFPLPDQLAKQLTCLGVNDRTEKRSGNSISNTVCCSSEQRTDCRINGLAECIADGHQFCSIHNCIDRSNCLRAFDSADRNSDCGSCRSTNGETGQSVFDRSAQRPKCPESFGVFETVPKSGSRRVQIRSQMGTEDKGGHGRFGSLCGDRNLDPDYLANHVASQGIQSCADS